MPQYLRTNPPPGTFHSVKVTVTSAMGAVAVGDLIKYNDGVGMVFRAAAVGEETVLVYVAEKIMVPKKTGAGEVFGTPLLHVYFDTATGNVTPTQAPGLYRIGVNTETATVDDTEVEIDLEGKLPLVEV